jgi:predicted ATP-binding protein involved in virulence
MNANTTLRLDQLVLKNFRCFAECTIDLHPQLTVLVAENGQGKTAVLDSVALALAVFVNSVAKTKQLPGFERTDARQIFADNLTMHSEWPIQIHAKSIIMDEVVEWSRIRDSHQAHTTTKGSKQLQLEVERLRKEVESIDIEEERSASTLPLVAFYGTGRLWSEHRLTAGKRIYHTVGADRTSGYIDCLSSSSSFKGVVAWYSALWNAVRDPASVVLPYFMRPQKLLAAVQEATRVVLSPTKWSTLGWDFEQQRMLVRHPIHGELPLALLSDGIRTMIALVADIAYRCASLNPHLGENAARKTPGIVIIDEVDMHLHPSWQQQVVALLQEAFPSLQLLLSTHSPHVLSTVDRDSIRIIRLRDGKGILEIPEFQTRGVESADVLALIMGVDPVPHVQESQWLNDYRVLIQTDRHRSPEGRQLWEKIIDHFGNNHPIISQIETLHRIQDFKQQHRNI